MVSTTLSIIQEETTDNHRDNLSLSQSQLTGHMVASITNRVKAVNTDKVVNMEVSMVKVDKADTTGWRSPHHSGGSQ